MHTSAFPTVLAFSPSPPRLPFPVCLGGADSRFFVAFHELHFFIISLLHSPHFFTSSLTQFTI